MAKQNEKKHTVQVLVEPGICGFTGSIKARRYKRWSALLNINSKCGQIKKMALQLDKITMKELFLPPAQNPVFCAAKQAGCHPSCPFPVAVLKAAEVAMELALPRDVRIVFKS